MHKLNARLIGAAILTLLLVGLGLARIARISTPAASPAETSTQQPPTGTPSGSTPSPTRTHTPTPTSTETPTPVPSSTPTPSATPEPPTLTPSPTPPIPIASHPPNAQGDVLVLVYHRIARPEDRWTRTPESFRQDLETLLALGYYPVNLIDYATGNLDQMVPRGRRPIVLTFDDSTAGHFRYLQDNSVDPDCAAGVLAAMHDAYDAYWPLRATFFVLLSDADEPGGALFRQPGRGAAKVRTLVECGMEVGSHTITHANLGDISAEQVAWELAASQERIEALLSGYRVRSLALPYGAYPQEPALVETGHSETAQRDYRYEAVVRLGSRPAPSPHSPDFDPLFIPRVQAIQSQLDQWIAYYEQHPERYYVSDGCAHE